MTNTLTDTHTHVYSTCIICYYVIAHSFLLHSLSPQKSPLPKRPTLGVLSTPLPSNLSPASKGEPSSGRLQQSSVEVEVTGDGGGGEGGTHGQDASVRF